MKPEFTGRSTSRSIGESTSRSTGESTSRPARRATIFDDRRGGFTLIEVMVVIAVIAVLAALVAPNVFRHLGAAKDTTARAQIEMIGAALDAYRLDNGRYPTTEQGLDALWDPPTLQPLPQNWRGPYLKKAIPLDPWGNAYIYMNPAQFSRGGYDLISLGADGEFGGEGEDADIVSWE